MTKKSSKIHDTVFGALKHIRLWKVGLIILTHYKPSPQIGSYRHLFFQNSWRFSAGTRSLHHKCRHRCMKPFFIQSEGDRGVSFSNGSHVTEGGQATHTNINPVHGTYYHTTHRSTSLMVSVHADEAYIPSSGCLFCLFLPAHSVSYFRPATSLHSLAYV